MAPRFQAPKGTYDVLPGTLSDEQLEREPWISSGCWLALEEMIRDWARRYDFGEIRTPLFEATDLFTRSVGEVTDIVSKEMYTFEDRGGRSLTLRPEGTAPCVRALLEAGRLQPGTSARVYYLESMFRYERPQAGRFRQHTQFGAEWYGSPGPEVEVELIRMMWDLLSSLGLHDLEVCVNSIGTAADRQAYREVLLQVLLPKKAQLSRESQERLERNPLRILDSKDPGDQELVAQLPQLMEVASPETRARFGRVVELLTSLGVPFRVSAQLVRGFDYYTHTVWEVVAKGIGAQASLGGGGRYDHLVHELGGAPISGAGFGLGVERLLAVLARAQNIPKMSQTVDILIVSLDEESVVSAMQVAHAARSIGLATAWQPELRKLKAAVTRAAQEEIPYLVLIGEEERSAGGVAVRNMLDRSQSLVPMADLEAALESIKSVCQHASMRG